MRQRLLWWQLEMEHRRRLALPLLSLVPVRFQSDEFTLVLDLAVGLGGVCSRPDADVIPLLAVPQGSEHGVAAAARLRLQLQRPISTDVPAGGLFAAAELLVRTISKFHDLTANNRGWLVVREEDLSFTNH
jgi:hypothetical protein